MQKLVLLDLFVEVHTLPLPYLQLLWLPWTSIRLRLRPSIQTIPPNNILHLLPCYSGIGTDSSLRSIAPVHAIRFDY